MALSSGNTTTTQVTPAVNAWLDTTLLQRAYPYFLHTRWAQVRPLSQGVGTVIKFRRYTNLDAQTTALTEGVTPAGQQLAITDITGTPLQYGNYVLFTDLLDWTVIENMKTEIAAMLGDNMGDTLDQVCRDTILAGTTVQYVQGVAGRTSVASGMIITGDEIRKAVRTLKGNNAKKITSQINPSTGWNTTPIRAAYIGIVSQQVEYDLKKDPDFVPVSEYPNPASALEGEIGALDEVRFFGATSNAKVFSAGGSGGIDVHGVQIFGQEYYGVTQISGHAAEVIVHPLGSSGSLDPLNQRQTMGWKATFVAVRLNENFGLRLEVAVSS